MELTLTCNCIYKAFLFLCLSLSTCIYIRGNYRTTSVYIFTMYVEAYRLTSTHVQCIH